MSKGDIVNVTLEYGKVTRVEATGMSSEISGEIQSILISATPQITLLTADQEAKVIKIKPDMTFVKDGESGSGDIYDLRLEQSVTIKMDGAGANTIVFNKPVEKTKFKAEILEVFQTANLLKVKDDAGQVWTVSFKEGATFSILDYEVGGSVFVFGIELSDDLFEAELVIGM